MSLNLSNNQGLSRHPRSPNGTRIHFHHFRAERFIRVRTSPCLDKQNHNHQHSVATYRNQRIPSAFIHNPLAIPPSTTTPIRSRFRGADATPFRAWKRLQTKRLKVELFQRIFQIPLNDAVNSGEQVETDFVKEQNHDLSPNHPRKQSGLISKCPKTPKEDANEDFELA